MGLITTILDHVPLPQDSLLKKAKKVIKVGKTAYDTTRKVDKHFGGRPTDWVAKKTFKHIGPASKGLITKVDKASEFYHKYNTEAKLAKAAGKLIQRGYSKVVKSISTKTLQRNPSGPKATPPNLIPSHSTPFPKTGKGPQQNPSLKLPNIPNYKLREPKLGKSLPFKSFKAGHSLGNHKAKVNLNALANHKLFTIKQQASKSAFNPAKNKMFSIKTQATSSKFNHAKTKSFAAKSRASFMPKFNTPKLKPPSMLSKSASKTTLKHHQPAFKSTPASRPSSVHKSPIRPGLKK